MSIYKEKIKAQIEQYKNVGQEKRNVADIQELPEMFHYWSNKYVLPLVVDILEANNIFEIYSIYFQKSLSEICETNKILSLGCGDCSFETKIAKDLLRRGVSDFVFECYDLSPHLIQRSKEKITRSRLGDHFVFFERDINYWQSDAIYCGVMAHQALHHVVELENLFYNIKKSLHSEGVFVVSDMIGRNGHMRWPEALDLVNSIWAFMPDHLKHNRQLNRFESYFCNRDCSIDGFEGIRSQDVLPLLRQYFHFDRFVAFGNLPEVFIERGFGHNFDPNDNLEMAFVDFLETLNRLLIDVGYLKPTMMFAILDMADGETRCHKHWTPEFCVRSVKSSLQMPQVKLTKLSLLDRVRRMF